MSAVEQSQTSVASVALKDLRANALVVLSSIFVLSTATHYLISDHLAPGPAAISTGAAVLLLIFAIAIRGLSHHQHRRFGLANTVTAVRAAIVSIVAAEVIFGGGSHVEIEAAWLLTGLVLFALSLDGLDGYLARSLAQESDFGARFDMEIDALFIFILSVAALLMGKAGWWVLLIGLMRYGFVAAQYVEPRLSAPLPPSFRRKLVCVVQVGALCLTLAPVILPPVSNLVALTALVLLTYSFAVDTHYLLRKRPQ